MLSIWLALGIPRLRSRGRIGKLFMIYALLFGILPAIFIVGLSGHIQDPISSEKDANRLFFFLLGTLALLLTILVVAMSSDSQSSSFVFIMLLSVTCGTVASISLQLFSDRKVWSHDKRKTILFFLIVLSLLILLGIVGDFTAPLFIVIGGVFLASVWKIWNWIGRKVLLVWAIQMILLCLSIWAADANTSLIESPSWLSDIVQLIILILIPMMAITVTAGMIYDVLIKGQTQDWYRILFISSLVVSIFFLIGYQIYLASVWDVATDGLGGVFFWMSASVSAIAIAMVMAWHLPGMRKLITLVFAVIVPLSMRYGMWAGSHAPDGQWGESPSYITERRAERIANAIQRYYEDYGSYPQALNDLFPRNLVYIHGPIMIPRQTWCYEGGQDFYRLGYVYRQYFSAPASVRIHASAGEPPDPYWPCDDEAAKYPPPPGYYNP